MKLRGAALILNLLAAVVVYGQAVDPGPRGGTVSSGQPIAGLSTDQLRFFQDGLTRFMSPDGVSSGLGPRFNGNFCGACHSQPAIGGSSPSTSAFPFVGPNPQVALATAAGAANTIPDFITVDSPIREVRFKYVISSPEPNPRSGFAGDRPVFDWDEQPTPDGTVHDLFTVTGRADAPGCNIAQPDFATAIAQNNAIFRIPTPVFGSGLIETISDATILSSFAATAAKRAALGIGGAPNRSSNDGTITRFGWKAQNKSLLIFAGEASNVEVGITNELFPQKRGDGSVPNPPSCIFNALPEDTGTFLPTGADTTQVFSDISAFANFMRFLDQPIPACTGAGCSASIQDGVTQFAQIGCALCHTASMKTDQSTFAVSLSGVQANLWSDLLLHHMGEHLADGVSQGNAGPDQFRTAPLWGLGQRVFFLHDGRTSNLLDAIEEHASRGSEANEVIRNFNALTAIEQQDILNFLRSL